MPLPGPRRSRQYTSSGRADRLAISIVPSVYCCLPLISYDSSLPLDLQNFIILPAEGAQHRHQSLTKRTSTFFLRQWSKTWKEPYPTSDPPSKYDQTSQRTGLRTKLWMKRGCISCVTVVHAAVSMTSHAKFCMENQEPCLN
jgi:hypothetical protein